MNYKKFTAKVDEETGKIAGFFSTYDRQPDSYGDIIEPGAFTKTIADREVTGHPFPLCFNHDFSSVIGAVNTIEDTEKGPYIEADFLDTQLAQDVRKMVKSGAIWQFSFAYDVTGYREPTKDEKKAGIFNVLTGVDVYEISVVTVPANQNAVMTDVKTAIEAEIKSGKRNSKSDEEIINQIIDLAKSLLTKADDTEKTEEGTEETQPEINEASEESKANGNSERAKAILERINLMKEVPDDED